MKSPIVTNPDNHIDNPGGYSDLQVMSSGAGYYVGTTYTDEDMFESPGSRDSGYFKTRKEAEAFLASLTEENARTLLRKDPAGD